MASYFQLRNHRPDTSDGIDETVKDPLLSEGFIDPEREGARSAPKSQGRTLADWFTLVLSSLMLLTSFAVYIDSTHVVTPRSAEGLRRPNPYPGLDEVHEFRKKGKGPLMWFPGPILRANRAMPDEEYARSSHVVLSENDSMFYQFRLKPNSFKWCYIDAVVPTPEEATKGGKSFMGSGDLYNIQVWNVSGPQRKMESLSWNTRPERVALLGTVAWLPEKERTEKMGWEDGWQLNPQTPRFECEGKKWLTFEVSCDNCTLAFEQLFSDPAMAFDLLQLA